MLKVVSGCQTVSLKPSLMSATILPKKIQFPLQHIPLTTIPRHPDCFHCFLCFKCLTRQRLCPMPFVVYQFQHALTKLAPPCYAPVGRLNFSDY
jgi:hypothetical protein